MVWRFNCEVNNFIMYFVFVKTCIWTVNKLIFRGLQYERIKVSAKWINVNDRIPLWHGHETCRNIGHNYGALLCSSKHHDKKKEPQGWSRSAVLNSSPRAPPLCIFRMLLLSLQMFVLLERKCPAKCTSQDIPPWFQFEANVYIPFKVHWSVQDVN